MNRSIPILGIVGAVMAALSATILVDPATLFAALFAIGAGGYLAVSKDWRRWGPAAAAILFGVLGILGVIGSVGGEDGSVEFPVSTDYGHAFIVIACLAVAASSALFLLGSEPTWLPYAWLGAAGLAALFALIVPGHLADQSTWGAYVVAVLSLVSMGGPIMARRRA